LKNLKKLYPDKTARMLAYGRMFGMPNNTKSEEEKLEEKLAKKRAKMAEVVEQEKVKKSNKIPLEQLRKLFYAD
jgi:hypothetical protein